MRTGINLPPRSVGHRGRLKARAKPIENFKEDRETKKEGIWETPREGREEYRPAEGDALRIMRWAGTGKIHLKNTTSRRGRLNVLLLTK